MPKDPRIAAVASCLREQVTVKRCEVLLEQSRASLRKRMVTAVKLGVPRVELARQLGMSESRVRQLIAPRSED